MALTVNRLLPTMDYMPKDLTPEGTNINGRLVKNMCIANSGVYTYGRWELRTLKVKDIPSKYDGQYVFRVLRPPEVVAKGANLFARQPITIGHPNCYVKPDNAQKLQHGFTGDSVTVEYGKDGEAYLYTTGTISTTEGIDAYARDGELSCGYDPIVEWKEGTYKGMEYQLVMTGYSDANHVAIVPKARGGQTCAFMDSSSLLLEAASKLPSNATGGNMSFLDGLLKKRQRPTGDEAINQAKLFLATLGSGADPAATIKTVMPLIEGLPACDSKSTLLSHLTELSNAKGVDNEVMAEAAKIVTSLIDEVAAYKPASDASSEILSAINKNNELLSQFVGSMANLTTAINGMQKPAGDAAAGESPMAGDSAPAVEEKKEESPPAGDSKEEKKEDEKKEEKATETPAGDAAAGSLTSPVAPAGTTANKMTSDSFMAKLMGGR